MNILLVEDNEGDQVIMQEAFQEAKVDCQLFIAKDGVEGIDFLTRQNEHKNAPRPDLVLLDLNLPRKNGREVLEELRKTQGLQHIPVLILSNSNSPKDICDCYALKANAYIGKPAKFQDFVDLAHMIQTFWFGLVHRCVH